jgi:hypothetical protein
MISCTVSLYIATLGGNVRFCRSECDKFVAVQGERTPLLLLYWHATGVIGRFEKQ